MLLNVMINDITSRSLDSHCERGLILCSEELHVCDQVFCKHMLLLLSRFSLVQLCATPERAAYQAPPSPGFSRQEHWSGLPFPSPMQESEK